MSNYYFTEVIFLEYSRNWLTYRELFEDEDSRSSDSVARKLRKKIEKLNLQPGEHIQIAIDFSEPNGVRKLCTMRGDSKRELAERVKALETAVADMKSHDMSRRIG